MTNSTSKMLETMAPLSLKSNSLPNAQRDTTLQNFSNPDQTLPREDEPMLVLDAQKPTPNFSDILTNCLNPNKKVEKLPQ